MLLPILRHIEREKLLKTFRKRSIFTFHVLVRRWTGFVHDTRCVVLFAFCISVGIWWMWDSVNRQVRLFMCEAFVVQIEANCATERFTLSFPGYDRKTHSNGKPRLKILVYESLRCIDPRVYVKGYAFLHCCFLLQFEDINCCSSLKLQRTASHWRDRIWTEVFDKESQHILFLNWANDREVPLFMQ